MWYEILPSMGIICGCLYLPQVASWYFNKAIFGNPIRRDQGSAYQQMMFLRDTRIDGSPWTIRGLENIPDK